MLQQRKGATFGYNITKYKKKGKFVMRYNEKIKFSISCQCFKGTLTPSDQASILETNKHSLALP
jgi:hypothetical protein